MIPDAHPCKHGWPLLWGLHWRTQEEAPRSRCRLAVTAVAKDILLIAKVLTWAADLVYLHGHCMQYLCEEDHECWSKNVS